MQVDQELLELIYEESWPASIRRAVEETGRRVELAADQHTNGVERAFEFRERLFFEWAFRAGVIAGQRAEREVGGRLSTRIEPTNMVRAFAAAGAYADHHEEARHLRQWEAQITAMPVDDEEDE